MMYVCKINRLSPKLDHFKHWSRHFSFFGVGQSLNYCYLHLSQSNSYCAFSCSISDFETMKIIRNQFSEAVLNIKVFSLLEVTFRFTNLRISAFLLKIWFLSSFSSQTSPRSKVKNSEFFLLNSSFTYANQAISLVGGVFKTKNPMIPL